MNTKIKHLSIIILLFFLGQNNKAFSQCYSNNIGLSKSTVSFDYDENNTWDNITVYIYSSNCTVNTITVPGAPQWVNVETTVNPSGGVYIGVQILEKNNGDYRSESVNVYINNANVASFTITQSGCPKTAWYLDTDNDNLGDPNSTPLYLCDEPGSSAEDYADNNDDQCPSQWGLAENNGCPVTDPDPDPDPSAGTYPEPDEIPENMNWISTKTYDLDYNVKSVTKSYYDPLGKPTQSQSWDIMTDKIWVNQTMYDYQGRPALQTLSTPIDDLTEFGYDTDFIKKSTSSNYTTSDFETNPENPAAVSSTSNTLGWYYSTSNQRERFQDVTPYPFSRTIYDELNPGNVLKTIGGNKVDINGSEQWASGFTYTMPAAQEPYYAFGREYFPEVSEAVLAQYNNDNTLLTHFNNSGRHVVTLKAYKTVSIDVHGVENVVFTDTDGKTLAAARSGSGASTADVKQVLSVIGEQGFTDIHIPSGISGNTITYLGGTGGYKVFNLRTSAQVTSNITNLPPGIYRIETTTNSTAPPFTYIENSSGNIELTSSGLKGVRYKVNYYDYSLNYYDKTGRLISTLPPIAYYNNYSLNQASRSYNEGLKTIYEYNTLGQLIYTKSPDEGEAWFKYRKDGQIRYSQNSKQKNAIIEEFSYTDYDHLGRPKESGVILSSNFNTADPNKVLLSGSKKEQNFTVYDTPETIIVDGTTYNQTFVAGNVAKTYTQYPSTSTTWYSYDIEGRVKWIIQDIAGLGKKTITYIYHNKNGLISQVNFQGQDPFGERFAYQYFYNDANQLEMVNSSFKVSPPLMGNASYEYYENGSLKRVNLGVDYNGNNGIQGVDYVYNLNGQLKAINHPSLSSGNDPGNDTNDVFGMELDYHNKDYRRGMQFDQTRYGTNQLNGNIKGMRWRNAFSQSANEFSYRYEYDRNNWLKNAIYGEYATTYLGSIPADLPDASVYESGTTTTRIARNSITLENNFWAKPGSTFTARIDDTDGFDENPNGDYNVTGLEYDANGNIQKLNRNKNTVSGSNAMDKLNYTYKTDKPNQLLRVDDAVTTTTNADDIKDQIAPENYKYNSIGQLIEDWENVTQAELNAYNSNNANIPSSVIYYEYNTSGLVTEVKKNNVSLVKFYYNERGQRVKKESYNTSGSLTNTYHYVRDASGNPLAIYINGVLKEHPIYGLDRIGVFYRNSDNSGGTTLYEITDHLGTVRALISSETGTMTGLKDYYPGGMPMPARNLQDAEGYRYGYQGEFAETDAETGKPAFELRLYDPRINRWLSPDPYGQHASPYMSMGNNWMNKIDPDGGEDWHYDDDGNLVVDAGDNAQTLAEFKGISLSEAQNIISAEGFLTDFTNGDGTGLMEGQVAYNRDFGAKYTFRAGETYQMEIIDKYLFEAVVLNYEQLTIKYNDEKIGSSGLGLGFMGADAGLFSKYRAKEISFNQNVSGDSLLEVFSQTGLINTDGFGATILYQRMRGYDSRQTMNLIWTAHFKGHGLSAGFSGASSVPDFKNISN